MTARTRLQSLGACAVFLLATASLVMPQASAHPPADPVITTPGPSVTVSNFLVIADVRPRDDDTLTGINLTLSPLDAGSQQAVIKATNLSGSFPVEVEWNGKYEAAVNATSTNKGGPLGIGAHGTQTSTTDKRQFSVAAPPATPSDVRAVVDKESRAVTVRWDANTEKDLLFYVVKRAKGDGAYSPLATTDGPGQISFVDPSTAESGGDYRYQVVAVRRGADAASGVTSDPSRPAAVTVPGPPGPPTTTAPGASSASTAPGAGTTPAGTTGTTFPANSPGALKKSGTLDLSGFSSIQKQSRRPGVRSQAPDPGFTSALPFAATDTTRLVDENEEEVEAPAEDTEVRELGAEDASNDRQRSAAFLAAGLLATVLLMHVLWIKGEVQREPLEVLVPE